jgi:hypothetical protein
VPKVEVDLDLQEILKLVPIPMKRAPRKKLVVMKDEDEGGDKVGKNLGGRGNSTPHCFKRRNGTYFCQKCKKKVN